MSTSQPLRKLGTAGRHHLIPFLMLVLVVGSLNWPLILHLGTHFVGPPNADTLEIFWETNWLSTALFDRQTWPFYCPDVFYPKGWYLASGAQPSWYLLLLALPGRIWGAVRVTNLTMLATLVIGGMGIYLTCYHLTGDRLASWIGACVYISAPTLTLRLRGHLHTLLSAQALPYALWSLTRALDAPSERSALRRGALTGCFLSMCILGHWYFLFMGSLPLFAAWLFYPGRRISMRRKAYIGLSIALTCILILWPFALLTFQARQAMFGENPDFPLTYSDRFSLSPNYLFLPNPFHPLWGPPSVQRFPLFGEQDVASVGYVAWGLVFWGALSKRSKGRRVLLGMSLCALILAMGTTLHWAGKPIYVHRSPILAQVLRDTGLLEQAPANRVPLPLPGFFLYQLFPLYRSVRVWGRYTIPMMLGFACLAGLGAHRLRRRGTVRGLLALLAGAILFEGLTAPYIDLYTGKRQFSDISLNARPAVVAWLQRTPQDTVIIEYPRHTDVDKLALYNQSLHGRKLVNGYMSQIPQHILDVESRLGAIPSKSTVSLLRAWDVNYVLISARTDQTSQKILGKMREIPGLEQVATFDEAFAGYQQTLVFRVTEKPARTDRP